MFANLRHTLLAHPAPTPIVVRRPPQGEATWQGTERALGHQRSASLSDRDAAASYQALLFHTLGHVLLEAPYAAMTQQQTDADRGQSRGMFEGLPADHHPNTSAAAPHFYTDMEAQYLYGLDLMLSALPLRQHR